MQHSLCVDIHDATFITVGYGNSSEIGMEKAFERLAGGGSGHGSGSGGNNPSKGFQNLIRGIAEAKTKHVSILSITISLM